ncbi:acyl-CoA thioesterase [Thalassolituus sp. LLYu03]|uniref:acyl-CoA thioesterase n=1 Tax=Thalassolituus sp. LLYu03 TaxID=3421656 RepID=UPI003D27C39A
MTDIQAAELHPFDQAVQLDGHDGLYQGQTTAAFANMVGPFGGILAANMLSAVLRHPELLGSPVALTVNFAAPVADGEFTVQAQPVRTGRSTQHWWITLTQNDEVAVSATAITALRRDTWDAQDSECPDAPPADQVPRMPAVPVIPRFFRNYDLRLVRGGIAPLPQHEAQPADSSETLLWVRDEPARALDFPSLAAICDVFFPRIFVRRQKPAAAGTVSLTIHFHCDAAILQANGPRALLGHARAHRFHKGFSDQTAEIWTDEGVLLATTMQSVYYKE